MNANELPGPRGRLVSTFRFLRDPYRTTLAWRDEYGDPFFVRTINGNVVMTGRAEHLRAIFAAPPETFAPFGVQAVAPVVGPKSVLVLGGEPHRRERKLLLPPFHGARMRAYAETMRDVAVRRLSAAVGRPALVQELAQQITLEIIVRAIFGLDDPHEVDELSRSILHVIDAVHPAFIFAPWLQRELGGLGPYARFRRAFEESDRGLQEIVERRRRGGAGEDILGLLLAARHDDGSPMADDAVRDELRTLIVAGHETTAMTLAFLVDRLWRSPEALERAREEAKSHADAPATELASLPFIDATVKETLRVRPIVTEMMRTVVSPFALGEIELGPGDHVGASAVMAHYDPERYPEPEAWRPERFVGKAAAPLDYFPFGGGHRRCIGAAFADMELRIVMATLLAGYDLSLRSGSIAPPVRRNLTMGPKGGVPVVLTATPATPSAARIAHRASDDHVGART